jgi:shikimate kinase
MQMHEASDAAAASSPLLKQGDGAARAQPAAELERACILVGMPGVGKTTIGRRLAHRLGADFVDLDAAIEAETGGSIRSYFELYGEAAFRELEAQLLGRALAAGACVLATGGGAVLRPDNCRAMREGGTVIYLRTSPDLLARRLRNDARRPLLQVGDPAKKLKELYAARDPLYRAAAHYVIDTQRGSIATVVNHIIMQLNMMNA